VMARERSLQMTCDEAARRVELTAPPDLARRFDWLPGEIWPANGRFVLSADVDLIQDEIRRSRKEEARWPAVQYLWPLHPLVEWINDGVLAAFRRHQAPVLGLAGTLGPDERAFLISGLIPNRKGHPLLHRWMAVVFEGREVVRVETFEELQARTGLGRKPLPNRGRLLDVEALADRLPQAVKAARAALHQERAALLARIGAQLDERLAALETLKGNQVRQIEREFAASKQAEKTRQERLQARHREIDRLFGEHRSWVRETLTLEEHAYLQVVAVLTGEG